MVTRMPVVWMVDPDGNIRGQIVYRKVTFIPRFNDVGTWRLECRLTAKHFQAAAAGWRIVIDDVTGLHGGNVGEPELTQEGRQGTLVLSGKDDMRWLDRSLAWPDPTAPLLSQTVAYDVRTDVCSTVLIDYLAANRGPAATDTTRRIPALTIATDPVIGETVIGRARFTNMLELFQGLAITGEVGFRMAPTSISRDIEFQVYDPPDLYGPARFSIPLGNLKSVKWRLTAPEATVVIGGGRGEELDREFTIITNVVEENAWGRFEDFYDYRSASDSDSGAELSEGTDRRLTEQGAKQLVEVEPVDTPRLRYGVDYTLGSNVAVDVYGDLTAIATIREVEITADRSNADTGPVRTVKPRVGDLGATATQRHVIELRDAKARVSNLERR